MTCTIVGWIDLFSRDVYRRMVTDSWRHCIKHKGFRVHAYTIMSNHIHLVASCAPPFELESVMRDWKAFTARSIVDYLLDETNIESRRKWLLWQFAYHARCNKPAQDYQIWQHGSHPKILWDPEITAQKVNYTHNNAVRAGFVAHDFDWVYSSAPDYAEKRDFLLVPITNVWDWWAAQEQFGE